MAEQSYEGLQRHVRDLALPALDTWENQYADRDYHVRIEIPEFTCVCPKTGLPDFATLAIDYVPDRDCVELKSLKLYIVAYRGVGIFHEHAVNRILDDFVRAVKPRSVDIEGVFNARGGLATTVRAAWRRPATQQPS
ncbi:MAG: preQ(1) synthase [Planctomycetota bacterium]|nr:preQ(1) synthase [Planctomycetota bacterium]